MERFELIVTQPVQDDSANRVRYSELLRGVVRGCWFSQAKIEPVLNQRACILSGDLGETGDGLLSKWLH